MQWTSKVSGLSNGRPLGRGLSEGCLHIFEGLQKPPGTNAVEGGLPNFTIANSSFATQV